MDNHYNIGQEEDLISLKSQINSFWQQGHFGDFIGENNVRINYCAFTQSHFSKNLIIVPGRCESYIKYQELSYQFHLLGYNTFILDHRGQGLSERLTEDPHKGYVDSFDDYVSDLAQFVDLSISLAPANKNYLLAHSMGGAVTLRYLQKKQPTFNAIVLSSPMIAINSGRVPNKVAVKAVQFFHYVNLLCSKKSWYFFGHGKYKAKQFSNNNLTHSSIRYQSFRHLYQSNPQVQLGGVTFKWLVEAEKNRQRIGKTTSYLSVPTLILQSGNDVIVDNHSQDTFCQQQSLTLNASRPQPIVIEGARHELLFESDNYRTQALNHILAWFDQHP